VRTEIARSAEVSYQSLSIQDACEVFMLKSEADLQPFIDQETAKRAEDSNYEWVIKENRL
jgi:hypothetical protein